MTPRIGASVVSLCILSGCATIVKGSSQLIALTTPPVLGATCVLSNDRGSWTVVSPAVVTVDRSPAKMRIICNKPGFRQAVATMTPDFENWTVGDALAGGPVGLLVDESTGATHQYPHSFQVPMQSAAASPTN